MDGWCKRDAEQLPYRRASRTKLGMKCDETQNSKPFRLLDAKPGEKAGRATYLEANRQWIVLDGQFDFVAGTQQFHDRFLMCRRCDIATVDLQDAIAHSQLSTACGNARGNDLSMILH